MAISAGLADTALEALGTFIIGITAARILSPSELGAYALFFAGFTWFAAIPTNLIFIPFELGLLDVHHSVRLYGFGRVLRWGILAAIPAALLIPVVILVADTGEVNAGALTALTVTAGLAVLVFPLQNHMRRLFHLANRSELAAATSAVQFVVVVLSVLTLRILEFRAAAIPFGALAVAKVVSLSAAATMAIVTSRHKIKVNALSLSLKRLFIRGRWIVLQVMIQQVAGFVTASLLGRMVSFSALGYVEAARIVTRPVELLGQGVTASLGPRSMDAATTGNIPLAHHLRRTYLWILVPASSVYLLWVQFDSPINLFHDLIPVAYAAAGLITLRGLASLISGLGTPHRSELLALKRERDLALLESGCSPLQVLITALTVVPLGPYSVPFAASVAGLVQVSLRKRLADRVLRLRPGIDETSADPCESSPEKLTPFM